LQQLNLRAGQLSELLMQLAQAGGRLHSLRLTHLHMLPMHGSVADAASLPPHDALGIELLFAASSLTHLCKLTFLDCAVGLDCVSCIPSLQLLDLRLRVLPPVTKLELLLHRLPHLHCAIDVFRPQAAFPMQPRELNHLKQLALQCKGGRPMVDAWRDEKGRVRGTRTSCANNHHACLWGRSGHCSPRLWVRVCAVCSFVVYPYLRVAFQPSQLTKSERFPPSVIA
jgi:hypothetical protein